MEQKQKIRLKKLESILLYDKWLNRGPSELHMNIFEAWLNIRNLRIEKEENIITKRKELKRIQDQNFWIERKVKTKSINLKYTIPVELKDVNTRTILNAYLGRYGHYYRYEYYGDVSGVNINGVGYDEELIKYVLDNREHINRKRHGKVTNKHYGKKDKRLGRKKLK